MSILPYDDLPPGSTLLREYTADAITITARAGEPDDAVRRHLKSTSAIWACFPSAAAILICLLVFARPLWAHRDHLPWWTAIVFAIFVAAVHALLWQTRYLRLIESVENAFEQTTILRIDRLRLLIESTGPLGTRSVDWSASDVRAIRVAALEPSDEPRVREPLGAVRIDLITGESAFIFAGRTPAELIWVGRMLRQFLGSGATHLSTHTAR